MLLKLKKSFCLLLLWVLFYYSGKASNKDSIYKDYPLKGGYHFIIKSMGKDTIASLIVKGDNLNSIDFGDRSMSADALGYVLADFNDYFILAFHNGASPVQIEIVRKESGGVTLWGQTPFYQDTLKGILLFDGTHRKAGKIILYDFKRDRMELYAAPEDAYLFSYNWKLLDLTDTGFKIGYYNLKRVKSVKAFQRK
jgi:hypothetical protein